MLLTGCTWAVGTAGAGEPGPGDAADLVALVNAYRTGTVECEGEPAGGAHALGVDRNLARVQAGARDDPLSAARAAGYTAAKVQVVRLSGPDDPESAMQLLAARHCRVLLDVGLDDIGVARQGKDWLVVLARPLLDDNLGDWRETGQELLDEINAARAQARTCGGVRHEQAPPLRWDGQLARAALEHGRDMAGRNYFSHVSPDGMTLAHRVDEAGYAWLRVGENIAAGTPDPAEVVAGWLESPSHCATLMNPEFSHSGAAHAIGEDSDAVIYWAQVFAAPR